MTHATIAIVLAVFGLAGMACKHHESKAINWSTSRCWNRASWVCAWFVLGAWFMAMLLFAAEARP